MLSNPRKQGPPNIFSIKHVLECKRCVETVPFGVGLEEWKRVVVGMTSYGFQVWCARHQCNIAHFDFRGTKVVANVSAPRGVIWPSIQ